MTLDAYGQRRLAAYEPTSPDVFCIEVTDGDWSDASYDVHQLCLAIADETGRWPMLDRGGYIQINDETLLFAFRLDPWPEYWEPGTMERRIIHDQAWKECCAAYCRDTLGLARQRAWAAIGTGDRWPLADRGQLRSRWAFARIAWTDLWVVATIVVGRYRYRKHQGRCPWHTGTTPWRDYLAVMHALKEHPQETKAAREGPGEYQIIDRIEDGRMVPR